MIETARLRLRRARIEDLDALFAVFSDPRAMRYWDSLPHDDIARTRRWLAGVVAGGPPERDEFVLERAGRVIGKAGCWKRGELGFILHPEHWGQGLATEALRAIVPRCFASLGVTRLEADVDPRNAAALRLLGKLGFRESGRAERTCLVGDEWCDSVYLRLERSSV